MHSAVGLARSTDTAIPSLTANIMNAAKKAAVSMLVSAHFCFAFVSSVDVVLNGDNRYGIEDGDETLPFAHGSS